MMRLLLLVVGVTLTAALLLGLVISVFVVAIIVTSRKYKSAGNLLLLQLGVADLLLALLGLTLSSPSLLQGKWIIPSKASISATPQSNISSSRDWLTSWENETILRFNASNEQDFSGGSSPNDSDFRIPVVQTLPSQPTTGVRLLPGRAQTTTDISWLSNAAYAEMSSVLSSAAAIAQSDTEDDSKNFKERDERGFVSGRKSEQYLLLSNRSSLLDTSHHLNGDVAITFAHDINEANGDNDDTSHEGINDSEERSPIYFSSIAIINDRYRDDGVICRLYGGVLTVLNLASVWIVVGLHCDKYCAIASPLRYNQIVTRKRIAFYSLIVWILSFSLSALVSSLAPDFLYIGGVCLPVWRKTGEIVYTVCLALILIVVPAIIFVLVNGKILLIARQHQHRIFSAIFEVMMSAQATVTQQRNPFDIPKMKQKSAWAICEQLIGFAVCYCPVLLFMFLECIILYPLSELLAVIMVGTLLLAPLVNSFIYGIKSATVKKIFKNYLRKKISRSAMKCEIQARIPSAQNSRRPSISSTLGFPAIQKSLQRRMSDYLSPDNLPETDPRDLARRSSDLSWHPLDDGTPTSSRLRQPLDIDFSGEWPSQATSASQYLAVPTFDAARSFGPGSIVGNFVSTSSLESDGAFSAKEHATEDEMQATSTEISPAFINRTENTKESTEDQMKQIEYCLSTSDEEFPIPNGNMNSMLSVTMPLYRRESSGISSVTSEDAQIITSRTPLLCRAYMKPWPKVETANTNSPYILRTLESLMSVGLCQSRLLKSGSIWRGNSFEKKFKNNARQDSLLSEDGQETISLEMTNNLSCVDLILGDTIMTLQAEEQETTLQDASVVLAQ